MTELKLEAQLKPILKQFTASVDSRIVNNDVMIKCGKFFADHLAIRLGGRGFSEELDVVRSFVDDFAPNATETLVTMFNSNHPMLPEIWKNPPQKTLEILLTLSNIEIEKLKKVQNERDDLSFEDKISKLIDFQNALQALQPSGTGEVPGSSLR